MILFKTRFLQVFLVSFLSTGSVFADDFIPEGVDETGSDYFTLGVNNDLGNLSLQFGNNLGEYLQWSSADARFKLSDDLDLENNQLVNIRLENLATAPTCDGTVSGKIYFNTIDSHTYACQNSAWTRLDKAGVEVNSATQNIDYNAVAVNTIYLLSATAANRPANKSYIVKTLGDTNIKTQVATATNEKYFRTFQASTWSGWSKLKTKKYAGYTIGEIDQTDGTGSYIGRVRDSDSKWLITRSNSTGFAYAQIESNASTPDMATAWADRLTLVYSSTFTP